MDGFSVYEMATYLRFHYKDVLKYISAITRSSRMIFGFHHNIPSLVPDDPHSCSWLNFAVETSYAPRITSMNLFPTSRTAIGLKTGIPTTRTQLMVTRCSITYLALATQTQFSYAHSQIIVEHTRIDKSWWRWRRIELRVRRALVQVLPAFRYIPSRLGITALRS